MSLAAVLAVLALAASGQDASAPPAGAPPIGAPVAPAPPTIDSLLDQAPMDEDARAAAVRSAFAEAEARRGSLDGRWRLTGRNGHMLYIFQLSDPGDVPDPRSASPHVPVIEGAWRDPDRDGHADGSGFLASVQRSGDRLTLRFELSPDQRLEREVVLRLTPGGDWTGELNGGDAPRAVTMRRF